LLQLFQDGDNDLKVKVVNTFGKLMLYEEESFLIQVYEHESEEVRLEILKALGRLSVGHAVPFLRQQFENLSLPASYRKHSLRSIYSLRKTAPGIMEELEQQAADENLTLIKYIKNPLIKYI
jgi:HEAT repeat protein